MKIFKLNYYRVFFEALIFIIAFVIFTFFYDPNLPGIVSSPNKFHYDLLAMFWFVPGLLAIKPIYRLLFCQEILVLEQNLLIKRRWISDKVIPLSSENSYEVFFHNTPIVPGFYSLIITTAKNKKKKFSPFLKMKTGLMK